MSSARPSKPLRARISAQTGPGAIDLLEESFHRLRAAPAGALAAYYLGSLPFVLGLLYFWADMGRAADAARRVTGGAFWLALLFLWMKGCHAVFAAGMRARFGRRPPVTFTPARLLRLAAVQTAIQPTGLLLIPLAAVLTFPLGWVYAFYQNVTALGDGDGTTAGRVAARAWRACRLWPRQNHVALALLTLLGMFVWLNIRSAVTNAPLLLRQFTGEENVFTRSTEFLSNTTFLAVTVSLVWLALDPLVKTFYALRCFYGGAVHSADDLRSALLALPPVAATPTAVRAPSLALALGLCLLAPFSSVIAAEAPAPTPAVAPASGSGVSPDSLRESVTEVLKRREFVWRQPHEIPADQAVSSWSIETPAFVTNGWRWVKDHAKSAGWWLLKWLRHLTQSSPASPAGPDDHAAGAARLGAVLRFTVYAAAGVLAVVLGFLLWRTWQQRRKRRELTGRAAPAAPAVPDVADDQVLATQLPEDEWLSLARQLLERGERRLALRAFYLSTLANLGGRGLLAIARHKSNRDYLGELRRRARDLGAVQEAFARNVRRFERVWYGRHPADEPLLAEFLADREALAAALPAAP